MQNFIVLGLIPGTDIQVDFGMWLTISLSLIALATLIRMVYKHARKVETLAPAINSEQLSLL